MDETWAKEQARRQITGATPEEMAQVGTGRYGPNAHLPEYTKRALELGAVAGRVPLASPRVIAGPITTARADRLRKPTADRTPLPVGRILMTMVAAPLLATAVLVGTGVATTPDTAGIDAQALASAPIDRAAYASTDAKVNALARIPSTTLAAQYLSNSSPGWTTLDESERNAMRAIWLRYTADPQSFLNLEQDQQWFFKQAFDSYLLELGRTTGDAKPLIDRGRLYLSNLGSPAYPNAARWKWREGTLIIPSDPSLEALAQNGSQAGRWFDWFKRGLATWGLHPRVD